jgi:hypothetical protein
MDFTPTHIVPTHIVTISRTANIPTRRVLSTRRELVMLDTETGAGYTAQDWAAGEPSPSWEVDEGAWWPIPRTGNQEWTVEEIGTDLRELASALREAGDWACGDSPIEAAHEWTEAGLASEAMAWVASRTFDPWAAKKLSAVGCTPKQAAYRVGEGAETLGYRVSNGDLTARRALDLARAQELDTPCYHCHEAEATEAHDTYCERCVEAPDAWDASDRALLERLGRRECREWRARAWEAGDYATVDLLDASGITGQSRWESLAARAEREGVSQATIRRAIERGLVSRKVGSLLEVDACSPLPPVAKTGPKGPRTPANEEGAE